MGTREVLRAQLDAVKADLHALQVENRRLKEDRPEQAALLQTETDLTQTQHQAVVAPRNPFCATPTLSPPRGMGLRQ